jgi:hypothetical protein
MDQTEDPRELERKIERANRIASRVTDQTTSELLGDVLHPVAAPASAVPSTRLEPALGNFGSKTVAPQAVTWSSGFKPRRRLSSVIESDRLAQR